MIKYMFIWLIIIFSFIYFGFFVLKVCLLPQMSKEFIEHLYVNNEKIVYNSEILRVGDEVLVDIEIIPKIINSMTYRLDWRNKSDRKIIFKSGKTLTIEMGLLENDIKINGQLKRLSIPPLYYKSVMVPISVFKKIYKFKIKFYPERNQNISFNKRVELFIRHILSIKFIHKIKSVFTPPMVFKILLGFAFTTAWVLNGHLPKKSKTESSERFASLKAYIKSDEKERRNFISRKIRVLFRFLLFILIRLRKIIGGSLYYVCTPAGFMVFITLILYLLYNFYIEVFNEIYF